MEEEQDPAEFDIGDEDGILEQTQGEPSLGATNDVDQRLAWRKSYSDGWFSYDHREPERFGREPEY